MDCCWRSGVGLQVGSDVHKEASERHGCSLADGTGSSGFHIDGYWDEGLERSGTNNEYCSARWSMLDVATRTEDSDRACFQGWTSDRVRANRLGRVAVVRSNALGVTGRSNVVA